MKRLLLIVLVGAVLILPVLLPRGTLHPVGNVSSQENILRTKIFGNQTLNDGLVDTPQRKLTHDIVEFQYTRYINLSEVHILSTENKKLQITIDGSKQTNDPGYPVLPYFIETFELPYQSKIVDVRVRLIGKSVLVTSISKDDLVLGTPIFTEGKQGPVIIGTNVSFEYYPFTQYKILFNGAFRNHRLLSIAVYPVLYNAFERNVYIFKDVEISILYKFSPTPIPAKAQFVENILHNINLVKIEPPADFQPQKQSLYMISGLDLVNYTETVTYLDLLIITTNAYKQEANRLAEWKIQRGIKTKVMTVEDINSSIAGRDVQERIRNYIKDTYTNKGIKWVLLIGDADDVPPRYVYAHDDYANDGDYVPSDYYYAGLDGTWDSDSDDVFGEENDIDWYPEVLVGRIPVSNIDELKTIVDRIIDYESTAPFDNSIFKQAILAGAYSNYDADTNHDNIKDYDKTDEAKLNYYIMNDFIVPLGFNYTRLYEAAGLDPTDYTYDYPLNEQNMVNVLSQGALLVNLAGHGSPDAIWRKVWTNDIDSDNLDDEGDEDSWYPYLSINSTVSTSVTYPIIYMDACYTGAFDWSENNSLAEYLLKHIGIGVIASTRVSWYAIAWDPGTDGGYWNQGLDYRFWEQLINYHKTYAVDALYASKIDYINDKGFDADNATLKNILDYTYFGDPTLLIPAYTDEGSSWTVTSPQTVENWVLRVSGDVIIYSSLKLYNSTLYIEGTGGTRSIYVYGELQVVDSRIIGKGNTTLFNVAKGANLTIINSELSNQNLRIYTDNVTINGSAIHNGKGVYIYNATNVTISNSYFTGNEYGIWATLTTNSRFLSNYVYNNSIYGIRVTKSNKINIENNTVIENVQFGMTLYNNTNLLVAHNQLYYDQIYLDSTQDNLTAGYLTLTDNTLNKKPIILHTNINNVQFDGLDLGQLIILFGQAVTILNINAFAIQINHIDTLYINNAMLSNADRGLVIWHAKHISLSNIRSVDSNAGVQLTFVSDALITNSWIEETDVGIFIAVSENVSAESNNILFSRGNSIYIVQSNFVNIFNNSLMNATSANILSYISSNVYIDKNDIMYGYAGVGIWYYYTSSNEVNENITIVNNYVEKYIRYNASTWGISVAYDTNTDIVRNIYIGNNTVTDATYGVEVWSYNRVDNVTIEDNLLYHCYTDILLKSQINSSRILHNKLMNSTYGLFIDNVNNVLIYSNLVKDIIQPVYINASNGLLIYFNGFINYANLPYDPGTNQWDNGTHGNYWSDYNGTDLNDDGIGDTMYKIDENSIDRYPLIYCYALDDNAAPSITLSSTYLNMSVVSSDTFVISWSIVDPNFYEARVYLNDTLLSKSDNGNSSYTLSLPSEETYVVKVIAIDKANNRAEANWVITRDTTKPSLSVESSLNNNSVVTQSWINVSWSASDKHLDNITLYINGVVAHTTTEKIGWYSLPLSQDGEYYINVTAFDLGGNSNSTIIKISRDTQPPTVSTILNPLNNTLTNSSTITLQFNVTDAHNWILYIYVNDAQEFSFTTNGSWVYTATDGTLIIKVVAVDAAHNMQNITYVVSIDRTPPTINLVSPNSLDFYTNKTSVNITLSASDNISGIDTILVNLDNVKWYNITSSLFLLLDNLSEGNHTIVIVAKDKVGNSIQVRISLTVDITDPTVTIRSPDNFTEVNTGDNLVISWSISDNLGVNEIRIYDNDTLITTLASDKESYTLRFNNPGVHQIKVMVIDKAGNTNCAILIIKANEAGGTIFGISTTTLALVGVVLAVVVVAITIKKRK